MQKKVSNGTLNKKRFKVRNTKSYHAYEQIFLRKIVILSYRQGKMFPGIIFRYLLILKGSCCCSRTPTSSHHSLAQESTRTIFQVHHLKPFNNCSPYLSTPLFLSLHMPTTDLAENFQVTPNIWPCLQTFAEFSPPLIAVTV